MCIRDRMTPSHAVKNDTRYRYYVSRPLIANDQTEGSAGLRIPAVELEQLVDQPACASGFSIPAASAKRLRRASLILQHREGLPRAPGRSENAGPSYR